MHGWYHNRSIPENQDRRGRPPCLPLFTPPCLPFSIPNNAIPGLFGQPGGSGNHGGGGGVPLRPGYKMEGCPTWLQSAKIRHQVMKIRLRTMVFQTISVSTKKIRIARFNNR